MCNALCKALKNELYYFHLEVAELYCCKNQTINQLTTYLYYFYFCEKHGKVIRPFCTSGRRFLELDVSIHRLYR